MFRVLEAEMVLKNKSREDMARAIGSTVGTFGLKLRGKYPFTLNDLRNIKAELQTDKSIDELFKEEE